MGTDRHLGYCQRASQVSKNPNSSPQSGDKESCRTGGVVERWGDWVGQVWDHPWKRGLLRLELVALQVGERGI